MKKLAPPLSIVLAITGCASTPQPQVRTLSYEEASAFEREFLARPVEAREEPEKLFIQPVNKDAPCKLPTSKDQLARTNFKAYWDGQCKNGYAFGLGRDIAISDTHHREEITIHAESDAYRPGQPFVGYDFVNNIVSYSVSGDRFPAMSGTVQIIRTEPEFNINIVTGLNNGDGTSLSLMSSPLRAERTYTYQNRNISYVINDVSGSPSTDPNPVTLVFRIVDPLTGNDGGVRAFKFRNGMVRHEKIGIDGRVEIVRIPQEYVDHLAALMLEVERSMARANDSTQKAQQIEREYKYMACNGKHIIKGLDNEIATKICTWNDQWKEPFSQAQARYMQQLEQARQQAANTEQQRLIQQQIVARQQAVAQQQSMLMMQQSQQSIERSNQQTSQMLQGILSNPAQVQPITPPGGNQITCINGGVVTTCQY